MTDLEAAVRVANGPRHDNPIIIKKDQTTGTIKAHSRNVVVMGTVKGDVIQSGHGDIAVFGGTVYGNVIERGNGSVHLRGAVVGSVRERFYGGVDAYDSTIRGNLCEQQPHWVGPRPVRAWNVSLRNTSVRSWCCCTRTGPC